MCHTDPPSGRKALLGQLLEVPPAASPQLSASLLDNLSQKKAASPKAMFPGQVTNPQQLRTASELILLSPELPLELAEAQSCSFPLLLPFSSQALIPWVFPIKPSVSKLHLRVSFPENRVCETRFLAWLHEVSSGGMKAWTSLGWEAFTTGGCYGY